MKNDVHKISSEQFYINTADSLAALKSAKGFIYTVIAAAVVLNCVFHLFFGIFPVKNIKLKGNDEVAVVAGITADSYEKGDVILCIKDGDYYCALVSQPAASAANGVYISTPDGQRMVDPENICGKAEFVVLPFSCFGENTYQLAISINNLKKWQPQSHRL